MSHNNITEIGAVEIVEALKINPVLESLKVDKKWIKTMKPYNEQLLYNETVGRCYHIAVQDPSVLNDQCNKLVRTWGDNSYVSSIHLDA